MTTYQLTHEGYVVRNGETKIPIVDTPELPNTNPDFLAYKQWRTDGGEPTPAYGHPLTPQSCTSAQGERALFDLRDITDADVLAAIDKIEDAGNKYRARSAFQRATEWRRDSETTQTLAAILALSEADLDALFTYAVTVNV